MYVAILEPKLYLTVTVSETWNAFMECINSQKPKSYHSDV